MPYAIITLGEFLDQLADRLDDPFSAFFSRAELLDYTTETLRTWAAHTGYWVRRGSFNTTANVKDYDITNLVNYVQGPNTYYPLRLDVTDRDLINSLCHALIEPPITNWPGGWIGTEQFSLELVQNSAQLGVNLFQLATALITVAGSQVAAPVPINQYDLPEDLLSIRSCYWQTPENLQYPLARQDQYLRSLVQNNASIPDSYSVVATSPRRIEISPGVSDAGTLVYFYAPGHTSLLPTAAPTTLHIPTNISWAAKWFALFTLLNAEGERRDKFRAEYCATRMSDSVILSKVFPGILRSFINGEEVQLSAAWDQNSVAPNWRNITDSPDTPILHSFNHLGLSPIPNGVYNISFDVSANAPIPTNEADYLDLGSDIIQTLLNYAHHIACFKLGGQEFADSIPSYQQFLIEAMKYNSRLMAESHNFELLKEKSETPRRRKPVQLEEETT